MLGASALACGDKLNASRKRIGAQIHRAMNRAVKRDQIAVDRKAIADSGVEKKPVFRAQPHHSIREINAADLILVPGNWPQTVAV